MQKLMTSHRVGLRFVVRRVASACCGRCPLAVSNGGNPGSKGPGRNNLHCPGAGHAVRAIAEALESCEVVSSAWNCWDLLEVVKTEGCKAESYKRMFSRMRSRRFPSESVGVWGGRSPDPCDFMREASASFDHGL